MSDVQLMPELCVSALMALCLMAAALVLVRREGKRTGVAELPRRSLDFSRGRSRRWYIPVLFLVAGANVAIYGFMRRLEKPLPAPHIRMPAAALLFEVLCWRPGRRTGRSD